MRLFREHRQAVEHQVYPWGFTLLELLIVLGIIGMLASISLPAIRGIRKANVMDSAIGQLKDDLALARQKALTGRTTVHVVFVPDIANSTMSFSSAGNDQETADRLQENAFRSYALFAERTAGDQPGRPYFQYLTPWKTLPGGVVVATSEFDVLTQADWNMLAPVDRPFEYMPMPFPTVNGLTNVVPHIAFDPQGRLTYEFDPSTPLDNGNPQFDSEVIELKEASVLVKRKADGSFDGLDVLEKQTPGIYNNIVIDGFTGQARVDRPQIQ